MISLNIYNKFQLNNATYTIRTMTKGERITVRVFIGDIPANNRTYSVELETLRDMKAVNNQDAISILAKFAEDDFKNYFAS